MKVASHAGHERVLIYGHAHSLTSAIRLES